MNINFRLKNQYTVCISRDYNEAYVIRTRDEYLKLHSFSDRHAILITDSSYKAWYKRGYVHRTSGPARIWSNGDKHFWTNGSRIS